MKESLHISVHDEPSTSHESLLDRAYWEWKTSFEFFAPKIVAGIGFATGFFVGGVKHQNSARER
jgi:hypothetical protein